MRRKIRGKRTGDIIRNRRRRNVGGKYIIRLSRKFFSISFFFFLPYLQISLVFLEFLFLSFRLAMEMDWILIVGMYADGRILSKWLIRNIFNQWRSKNIRFRLWKIIIIDYLINLLILLKFCKKRNWWINKKKTKRKELWNNLIILEK